MASALLLVKSLNSFARRQTTRMSIFYLFCHVFSSSSNSCCCFVFIALPRISSSCQGCSSCHTLRTLLYLLCFLFSSIDVRDSKFDCLSFIPSMIQSILCLTRQSVSSSVRKWTPLKEHEPPDNVVKGVISKRRRSRRRK